MLNTDLKGVWEECKNNNVIHLILLFSICLFLYSMLAKYMKKQSEFNDIMILKGMLDMNNNCNKDIPRLDEAIIRNSINLPNRNPAMLTSSMIYPEPSKPSDEDIRKTRMDVLNMFYDSFDDDVTSITSRPQNLYIIP